MAKVDKNYKMECANCGCTFNANYRQKLNHKNKGTDVCCSKTCRYAKLAEKNKKEIPTRGPCPTCGKMYKSRQPKKFCSQDCYIKSDTFKKTTSEYYKSGDQKQCINCGNKYIAKNAMQKYCTEECKNDANSKVCENCGSDYLPTKTKQKYCGKNCYRESRKKLFDQWIASPETIDSPGNYDEFMTQEELPCLIEGCDWKGKHLGVHLNMKHGCKAEEFKRAAGFNLSTGLISPDLYNVISESNKGKGNPNPEMRSVGERTKECRENGDYSISDYTSNEAIEHQKKTTALLRIKPGEIRICNGCKKTYRTSSGISNNQKYCSVICRENHYRNKKKDK